MATSGSKLFYQHIRSATTGLRASWPRAGSSYSSRIASIGLAAGVLSIVAQRIESEENSLWKQPFKLYADSSAVIVHIHRDQKDGFRVDPDTSTPFPLRLNLASQTPQLTLVGLGVRKVSFLRVKVYSAGFYLEDSQTKRLDSLQGWHTFTAQHLLTPPTNTSNDPLDAPQISGEKLMRILLDQPIACAVRIVPVRNTDFSHLRDGFTRALQARQKIARTAGELNDRDEQRIAESMQSLKSFFPSQSVPKGKSLTLLRTTSGELTVEYEGKVLGTVQDSWVAREMMLAYFADQDVISPKLKEDVAAGLEGFLRNRL